MSFKYCPGKAGKAIFKQIKNRGISFDEEKTSSEEESDEDNDENNDTIKTTNKTEPEAEPGKADDLTNG